MPARFQSVTKYPNLNPNNVNTSFPAFSAPVLNPQLHCDLETFPVGGGLGNVVTDLLRGKTKRTDLTRFVSYDCQLDRKLLDIHLGSEGAGSTNFSSHSPQVDKLHLDRDKMAIKLPDHNVNQHLIGVELGSHCKCCGDLELVDEVKRNHYHRVAAEKNEVQKQLQTSQIADKYASVHAEITNAGNLP